MLLQANIYDLELKSRRETVKTFVLSPDDSIANRGVLFGVFSFNFSSTKNNNTIRSIIEMVASRFYDPENIADDPHQHFENVLQEVNIDIAKKIQSDDITINPKKVNALITLLSGKKISLAQVGDIKALLLLRTKDGMIHSTPIHDSLGDTVPTKFFSSVASGDVKHGQRLFISTAAVYDALGVKMIEKTSAKFPSEQAIEQFRNNLGSFTTAGAMMLIDFNDLSLGKTVQSEKSLNKLRSTEDSTTQILTSSFKSYVNTLMTKANKQLNQVKKSTQEIIKDKLANKSNKLVSGAKISKVKKEAPKPEPTEEKVTKETPITLSDSATESKTPSSAPIVKEVVAKISASSASIVASLKTQLAKLAVLKERQPRKPKHPRIRHPRKSRTFNTISSANRVINWFNRLPGKSKLIFIVGIVAAFLFAQSIVMIVKDKTTQEEKDSFTGVVTLIEEKLDAAEASIIFKDEKRTRQMLADVEATIARHPQKKEENQNVLTDLDNRRLLLLEKIRHAVTLENPEVIKDFSTLNEQASMLNIVELDNNIYAYDASDKFIYKLNLENNQVITLDGSESLQGTIKQSTPQSDNAILFADDQTSLYEVILDSRSVRVTDIIYGVENPSVAAIQVYNDRLYILDSANNQIYRHQKIDSGFGKGFSWIKQNNLNLNDAISMAIDGTIYILKSNGQIIRLTSGVQKPFSLGAIDPLVKTPAKIWTDQDSDFFYLLEPVARRLVVYKKSENDSGLAEIVVQYTSDKFNLLKDFVVKEDAKAIYLLNGNSIIKVDATHLED